MPSLRIWFISLFLLSCLLISAIKFLGIYFEAATPSWHQYVRSPGNASIYPLRVIQERTRGNVSNVRGLLRHGKGDTVLSRSPPLSHRLQHDRPTGRDKQQPLTPPTSEHIEEIPSIVVDFGQNIVGFPEISFSWASSNGPGIRLAFSETLEFLTERSDFSRSDNGDKITPGTDQLNVPKEPFIWKVQHGCLEDGKVCADGLHGFRYLKISLDALATDEPYAQPFGEVAISSVSVKLSSFPGTPGTFTGWFECSDPELNAFWYDAAYTNDMCIDVFRKNDTEPRNAASLSLIGKLVLHDGAKRDRDPYVGDLAVAARTLLLTHNVTEAVRNVLADLGDHQRDDGWIPPASINGYTLPLFDYPLWWIVCSYDLVLYTGDLEYARKYYSNIQQVLDKWYPSATNSASSLLSKGIGNTEGYGDYAFLPRNGPVTYYNVLYVLALNNAASLAKFLDVENDDAFRWTERASNVTAAINQNLWDAQVGAYLDSLTGPIRHAQDGNSIAVLAKVATPSQTCSLLSHLSTTALAYGNPFYDNDRLGLGFSKRVYPFISYFEILARFSSGEAHSAIDQIRRTYRWMRTHDPFSTFWEGIGTDGSMYEGGYTSAAHGWSTGVLPALTNHVLGVMPTGPGFQTWSIKPITGNIDWAQGVVPTPRGNISVQWVRHRDACQFKIRFDTPQDTAGEISVPLCEQAGGDVYLDEMQVWRQTAVGPDASTSTPGYLTLAVTGGQHEVTVQ